MRNKFRTILIALIVMALMIPAAAPAEILSVPVPMKEAAGTPAENDELAEAVRIGIIDTIPEGNISIAAFFEMLDRVIDRCAPEKMEQWRNLRNIAGNEMIGRDTGMLAVYEAACMLGLGATGRAYWLQTNTAMRQAFPEFRSYADGSIFSNTNDPGPFEANYGQNVGWDYVTCSFFYGMGQSSAIQPARFFNLFDGNGADPISCASAVRAVYRLYLSWEAEHEGSLTLAWDPWEEAELAEAAVAREAILNSPDSIVKSDQLIQGETYTGTAYYVSNSGNDENSGTSPEAAWATLKKVSNADLAYGDAVFFERGGIWYGGLRMTKGVTYAAYGEGPKPIWSGSIPGANEAENWIPVAETADGGKIWAYREPLADCGVIVLDSHIVGRKLYACWDGEQYTTREGEPFVNENEMTANLMFWSEIDLSGYALPVEPWTLERKGTLYFRCDEGNPAEVYQSIELGLDARGIQAADDGYTTIDNIAYRCFPCGGIDCGCQHHIVIQNCESCFNGGGIQSYERGNFGNIIISTSGAGMLLFGTDISARNNYIHDCESKGIAVVIGGGHPTTVRKNILAEGNVVERCGSGIFLMMHSIPGGKETVFEDVTFRGNYFIYPGYGWRIHNQTWNGTGYGSVGSNCEGIASSEMVFTGPVVIENNFFYHAAGPMIRYIGSALKDNAPTLKGNTFIQSEEQLLFVTFDNDHEENSIGVPAVDTQITRFRECSGDEMAEVRIVKGE